MNFNLLLHFIVATTVPYVGLSQDSYKVTLHISEGYKGTTVFVLPTEVHYPNLFKNYNVKYSHEGSSKSYFDVDEECGEVMLARDDRDYQQPKILQIAVHCFVHGKLYDGRDYYNITTARLQVVIKSGVVYNTLQQLAIGPTIREDSRVLNVGRRVSFSNNLVKQANVSFHSTISGQYGITSDGIIYARRKPINNHTFMFSFSVSGIGHTGHSFSYVERQQISFEVSKCSEVSDNFVTWPSTFACYQYEHNCSKFGSIFDDYGIVKRQCNKDGK
jgi:hypothetical protein